MPEKERVKQLRFKTGEQILTFGKNKHVLALEPGTQIFWGEWMCLGESKLMKMGFHEYVARYIKK